MQNLKFDLHQCHRWAVLLSERKQKLDLAIKAISLENFEMPRSLLSKSFMVVEAARISTLEC